jgi:hypothetical protein
LPPPVKRRVALARLRPRRTKRRAEPEKVTSDAKVTFERIPPAVVVWI